MFPKGRRLLRPDQGVMNHAPIKNEPTIVFLVGATPCGCPFYLDKPGQIWLQFLTGRVG